MKVLTTLAAVFAVVSLQSTGEKVGAPKTLTDDQPTMNLGAFSISLTVKDLAASRAFYEKLGFTEAGGEPSENWLILRNGTTTIGLFHGMFERNIMTFNPGWGAKATPLDEFTDVRELQKTFRERGISFSVEADESSTGPAHFALIDPDGNPVLFDQHVD